MATFVDQLFSIASENKISEVNSELFAKFMDSSDDLKDIRNEFIFPIINDRPSIYLCGNSLGLQPKGIRVELNKELDKWAREGVEGHFTGEDCWVEKESKLRKSMATLVGAKESEVVIMNSLTCNLHLMMMSFYKPTSNRYKILIEKKAFPSDYHAVVSQIQFHGFDAKEALIEVAPKEGEMFLTNEDISEALEANKDSVALVLFSGIQYYTGQLFDMETIVKLARAHGSKVGFDLAHAVGNVPLNLHAWGCDFACWCTYKYMNCGAGSIAGCFVHEIHGQPVLSDHSEDSFPTVEPFRLGGWWGHRPSDRFQMAPKFIPDDGANGFKLSNPPIMLLACVKASLDIFDKAGIDKLRKKSLLLTAFLEILLKSELSKQVKILTPSDPEQRGCQLSLSFDVLKKDSTPISCDEVLELLNKNAVICDVRRPNVIRIAPAPLYNSFYDVFEFVGILKNILNNA